MSVNNQNFRKKAIVYFNFINGILLITAGFTLLYFTPFLGNLVSDIAIDLGYGSAQRFYFIVSDFEFYSISLVILFLIVSIILFITGLGLLKEKRWSWFINKILWSLILLIFPIGTLFGIYVLWMITGKERN
ncbi:MAG: DUF2127 domain-containing protein [Promethearchaeota archaeon]